MSPAIAFYAHRVVYPNGTRSQPFIVSMCKRDLKRFSLRIIEDQWPEWKGCLLPDGRVDSAKMNAKRAADDFDSGSARMSFSHDGRFWETVRVLSRKCIAWDAQLGDVLLGRRDSKPVPGDSDDRLLSASELAILFGMSDEAAWRVLADLGIKDPDKALARTVLSWLPHIEEWESPR